MVTTDRQRGPTRSGALACLALTSIFAGLPDTAAAGREQPIVFCQVPVDHAPDAPRANGTLPADYGRGASLLRLEPDGAALRLAADFASACDPEVSFDGQRILFAGQRAPQDAWSIWEMAADGSEVRRITDGAFDARHPIYLATFYTITSSEPWYTILFVGEDGALNKPATARGTSLFTVRLDGSELRRITFHPGNDYSPYLMKDGRLLFAGLRQGSGGARVGIFGIHTDGIDYAAYAGWQGRRIQHMPTANDAGRIVFVEAETMDWAGAGRLAAVDAQRPSSTYRPLSGPGDGLFQSPTPLGEESLLVSQRNPDGVFRLVRFAPGSGVAEVFYADDRFHGLHARVLAPRPEPDGRSSTVRPESPTGKLFALDVYENDPRLSPISRGETRRVRVIEGVPTTSTTATSSPQLGSDMLFSQVFSRLLGEAPVEDDGSLHIDIPANLPVKLQLLDQDGLALASCDWIWVKEREFRGCIGCHEDPELTPPNRFVQAAGRPANDLTLEPGRRRTVTFENDVLPVLESRCQGCHRAGGDAADSRLVLRPGRTEAATEAFAALVTGDAPLVTPGIARTSPLIWRLFGRDTSRSWDRDGRPALEVPTDHLEYLDGDERNVFIEWIDLGAQRTRPGAPPPGGSALGASALGASAPGASPLEAPTATAEYPAAVESEEGATP